MILIPQVFSSTCIRNLDVNSAVELPRAEVGRQGAREQFTTLHVGASTIAEIESKILVNSVVNECENGWVSLHPRSHVSASTNATGWIVRSALNTTFENIEWVNIHFHLNLLHACEKMKYIHIIYTQVCGSKCVNLIRRWVGRRGDKKSATYPILAGHKKCWERLLENILLIVYVLKLKDTLKICHIQLIQYIFRLLSWHRTNVHW